MFYGFLLYCIYLNNCKFNRLTASSCKDNKGILNLFNFKLRDLNLSSSR